MKFYNEIPNIVYTPYTLIPDHERGISCTFQLPSLLQKSASGTIWIEQMGPRVSQEIFYN
jgi:hypothetical protein